LSQQLNALDFLPIACQFRLYFTYPEGQNNVVTKIVGHWTDFWLKQKSMISKQNFDSNVYCVSIKKMKWQA
jgi:hypothetical protein